VTKFHFLARSNTRLSVHSAIQFNDHDPMSFLAHLCSPMSHVNPFSGHFTEPPSTEELIRSSIYGGIERRC
jgi:hypothetical protein